MKILTLSIMIANELKNMIEQENLKEGDKLPSERELCEKLNVQRLTLRSGLRILMQEGIIISKQRSGYYVNKPRILSSAGIDILSACQLDQTSHIGILRGNDIGPWKTHEY